MPFRKMLRLPLISTLAATLWLGGCTAQVKPTSLQGEAPAQPGLSMCGTLALPSQWRPTENDTSVPLGGLSAMAWDQDDNLLHLVSDRGRVHQARPVLEDGRLVDLRPITSHRLKAQDGTLLEGKAADAESLVLARADDGVIGNTELLIGFEQDHRLQRFSVDGTPKGEPLRSTASHNAGDNESLEALARVPGIGLVAGLESPSADMTAQDGVRHTLLFSLAEDGSDTRRWHYPLASPVDSALTDLLALEDTVTETPPRLLALERAFSPPRPLTISLSLVELLPPPQVRVTRLASLSAGEGWRVDNMEGLARLPGGELLMVSDDNFSALQRNLLACFRLPDKALSLDTGSARANGR
ncbi:esterase-like activity of phytase family protein [Halomonas sp. YLB-10]|uniref:esterase-like activity of phytase family protein n=1 Tax=unclassified Halomonas TaxID=2609666 RepID=UPI000F5DEE45|nr:MULTISPECIES: esterase-like activity of phytase family protein [unclassified Halomonas]RQW69164.1 esterase-like activity of phytase family protein [Halomonas sp. YLB-10]